ncbi:hypothetical protein K488DRAFT_85254 [Vararia minispora EC-137]|uniref:Uncharacterized protein n=1 Tax=Vararia minispora EC-137 TaxID=1314806 RepID=A0ACB8QMK9_9AGAM|nr:hypothetical protein K488DRAFT_85254 [Vararia minispora EC-137]
MRGRKSVLVLAGLAYSAPPLSYRPLVHLIHLMGQIVERVWLVTGASRGLGMTLVRRLLARGDRVIATARKTGALDALLAEPGIDHTCMFSLQLDVTASPAELREVMKVAVAHWGHIDVLVNNAGFGDLGALEETSTEYATHIVQTNYFGVMNVTNALLPYLRARRSGKVIIMGSRMAYRTGYMGNGMYSASKAAVHAYGEALSVEMKPFGIDVMIAVPGAFDSGCSIAIKSGTKISDYDAMRESVAQTLEVRWQARNPGDPVKGMDALIDVVRGEGRAAGREGMPLWLPLGDDAIANMRERLEKLNKTIDDWEAVGARLGKLD